MGKARTRLLLGMLCILIQATSALAFDADTDSSLAGWWKLDDGAGSTARDSVSQGHNGTLTNGPVWTTGYAGNGLQFDGVDDYVDTGWTTNLSNWTLSCWVMCPEAPNSTSLPSGPVHRENNYQISWNHNNGGTWPGSVGANISGTWTNASLGTLQGKTWYFLCGTFDGTSLKAYTNGTLITTINASGTPNSDTNSFKFGRHAANAQYWSGTLDDVRVYSRALSESEIKLVMTAAAQGPATSPNPSDKSTDVAREVVLGWKAGPFAKTHDVYFGTNFNDVNAGSTTVLVSSQDANTYDPIGRLDFGTTYYWRVDEVNAPPSPTVFKGAVWSFTTEPLAYPITTKITAKASSQKSASEGPEKTIDGSGIANDVADVNSKAMWMSLSTKKGGTMPAWIQYDFDKLYKLQEMWVWNYNGGSELDMGAGAKSTAIEYLAADDQWVTLGNFEFAQGTALDGYAHNTTVPCGGVAAKAVRLTINETWGYEFQTGLSEVRFYYIPVWAKEPAPTTGKTGIDPTTLTLGWRTGREAAAHDVYLSTDANALTKVGTVPTAGYTPTVELATQYYWRIDEVNQTTNPTTWMGDVWSFTTLDFLTVDDMEIYNATDAAIFDTWLDGYGTSTNGGQVGYGQPANNTFCETTVIHGGTKSMPFLYGRDGITTSEATRTYATAQNWTAAGAKTLTLWFSGAPENSAVSLYVKINDTKIVYGGAADNIQRRRWNQWNIDLSTVPAATVKAVSKVVIGVTGSGTGTLLVDDLRLYKEAPEIPTPADPGTTGLVAYYQMNNNVQDSSGKGNNGTPVGTPTYAAGLSSSNLALVLNGTTDGVDLGKKDIFNPTGGFSISLWAKIGAWGTAWSHVMIGNRGEDNVGWQVRRGQGTGLCWTTRGAGGTADLTGATPAQNEWVHVTCVYDQAGATKTLYINGVMSITGTTTAGNTIAATTHNTYIGARALAANTGPDTATFFTGSLDEIRIFNRALTAGEADFLSKP